MIVNIKNNIIITNASSWFVLKGLFLIDFIILHQRKIIISKLKMFIPTIEMEPQNILGGTFYVFSSNSPNLHFHLLFGADIYYNISF